MPQRSRRVLGALSLALLLGATEGASRVGVWMLKWRLGLPEEPTYSHQFTDTQRRELQAIIDGSSRYIRFDAELGWSIAPGGAAGLYAANSRGLRASREYAASVPPGVFRVATFGDSFVHGDDVDNDSTWQAQMEQGQPGVEVLNHGVPGFGPDQSYLRYGRDGHSGARVVVIGVMTENIGRLSTRFRPYYFAHTGLPLTKPRFSLNGDALALVPNPVRTPGVLASLLAGDAASFADIGRGDDYFEGGFRRRPIDAIATARLARMLAYQVSEPARRLERLRSSEYLDGSDSLRLLTAVLTAFASDVSRDGAVPLVVVFPQASDLRRALDGQPKRHAPLLTALDASGTPWVDLTESMTDTARREGVEVLFRGHYSRRGNAAVAEALYPMLRQAAAPGRDAMRRTPPPPVRTSAAAPRDRTRAM